MRIYKFLVIFLAIIANNFYLFSNQEIFDGEINGNFITHHDNNSNLLYTLDTNLELKKINLENNIVETTQLKMIAKGESFQFNSLTIDNERSNMTNLGGIAEIYEKTLKNIINNFKLFHLDDNLFIIHDGGGIVLGIDGSNLSRIDDSFASMQKFDGDIFTYQGKIHHFGGYGFWRTNNTMLRFYNGDQQSNEWEEIISNNNFPNGLNRGISGFTSSLFENNYYIYGGKSTYNAKDYTNNSVYKYSFNNDSWTNLGQINYTRTKDDIILNSNNLFYVFNRSSAYIFDIEKMILTKYNYTNKFSYNKLSNNKGFISHFHRGAKFNDVHINDNCTKHKLYSINYHNSKYGISNINSYDIRNVIDLTNAETIPLFSRQRSRNDFLIPMLIVFIIIIINLLYMNIIEGKKPKIEELYTLENDELRFINRKIDIDNNSLIIIKMLLENNQITSNEIVAKLVDNGLSYDYASKVKNKIIESLNEKFKFITNSENPFITIGKSSEDKRIQILKIIKYNKKS